MLDKSQIDKFESLLGRKLDSSEIFRLQRIQNILKISDNDAIWDIIVAFEYQKTFYSKIPSEIEKIVDKIPTQEGIFPQQAAYTTITSNLIFAFLFTAISAVSMWVGYGLGRGQIEPQNSIMLMPVGYVLGVSCLAPAVFLGLNSAKSMSNGDLKGAVLKGCAALLFLVFCGMSLGNLF